LKILVKENDLPKFTICIYFIELFQAWSNAILSMNAMYEHVVDVVAVVLSSFKGNEHGVVVDVVAVLVLVYLEKDNNVKWIKYYL
jgi:hypothetical protein